MEANVTFATPARINGKMLNGCTLRLSTIGDEEDSQAMAVDLGRPLVPLTSEMCLFSALTGISYDDMRTLSLANYVRIRAAYREVNAMRPTNPAEKPDASPARQTDAAQKAQPDTMQPSS
ncbi:MAG: phage tail assembly protein [Deltaproteobacteria bacterium]|jgi:hypothetical protein|nr:phage tail assembly protein [Deltaproteobacteria bacterium]